MSFARFRLARGVAVSGRRGRALSMRGRGSRSAWRGRVDTTVAWVGVLSFARVLPSHGIEAVEGGLARARLCVRSRFLLRPLSGAGASLPRPQLETPQLLPMDILALATMKNAAKCDT